MHTMTYVIPTSLLFLLAADSAALASTKWYVDGLNGNDNNVCRSLQTACRTIGHAMSLAASGDSIKVAPATYDENLYFLTNLNVIGAGATKTIIDGVGSNTVGIGGTTVTLSGLTITNGDPGIWNNQGALTIRNSAIIGNTSFQGGAGIDSYGGSITTENSTVSGNLAYASTTFGGGISSSGNITIDNSTISGNTARGGYAVGGDIYNDGTLTISNSTISRGSAANGGGGIYSYTGYGGSVTLQNTIVADNHSGGNCNGTVVSSGYNLSSDDTCNFNNVGDLNMINARLGRLQYNGGPTQTQVLDAGSPAIDAGNPSGCTNGQGNLLTTDQRGKPRPDKEDTSGCDMGAYERQKD